MEGLPNSFFSPQPIQTEEDPNSLLNLLEQLSLYGSSFPPPSADPFSNTAADNWIPPSDLDFLHGRQNIPSYNYADDADLLRLRVNSAALGYDYRTPRTNMDSYDSYESVARSYAMLANANRLMNGGGRFNPIPTQTPNRTVRISTNNSTRRRSNSYNYRNGMSNDGMNNVILPSWADLKGRFVGFCLDATWSNILLRMLEGLTDYRSLDIVIPEIKEDIIRITTDPLGNPVFNKILEVCDDHHISEILEAVMSNNNQFLNICFHSRGTYGVQNLVQRLNKNDQHHRDMVASAIVNNVLRLTKDSNGNYVVKACLGVFEGVNDVIQPILMEIGNHFLELAKDKSGCCVLQQCLALSEGQIGRNRLIDLVISNAHQLSEHEYGNYVVQNLIGMRNGIAITLISKLRGSFVVLTKNKYGSHVVEKCLKESRYDIVKMIVMELCNDPHFLDILQDPMGNYVAQSALHITKAMAVEHSPSRSFHQMLVNRIQNHQAFLHSHPFGKKVLAHAKCSCSPSETGFKVDYRSY